MTMNCTTAGRIGSSQHTMDTCPAVGSSARTPSSPPQVIVMMMMILMIVMMMMMMMMMLVTVMMIVMVVDSDDDNATLLHNRSSHRYTIQHWEIPHPCLPLLNIDQVTSRVWYGTSSRGSASTPSLSTRETSWAYRSYPPSIPTCSCQVSDHDDDG